MSDFSGYLVIPRKIFRPHSPKPINFQQKFPLKVDNMDAAIYNILKINEMQNQ